MKRDFARIEKSSIRSDDERMETIGKSAETVVEALTAALTLDGAAPAQSTLAALTRGTALICPAETVCVDDVAGNDATGNGSPSAPYKTVAGAFIAKSDAVSVLVRQVKDDAESWEPATASAVKKGKKLFEQHVKRLATAEKVRQRDAEEGEAKRAAELKRLDDARKIVFSEPQGELAAKIKIRQAVDSRGKRVRVFGWVHRLRSQGGMTFIVLRDGTGYLQCVLTGDFVSDSSTWTRTDHLLSVAMLRRPHPHT